MTLAFSPIFEMIQPSWQLLYTVVDALYPDYVGAYYHDSDHPSPDGARAEELLNAYQLASNVDNQERIKRC